MGWAARTGHKGPGMRITNPRCAPLRPWSIVTINAALNHEFNIGKSRRSDVDGARDGVVGAQKVIR